MAFNITELKGAISRGIARPNMYRVTIHYKKLNPFGMRQLQILCEAAELPGRQFDTTPELMYGVARKMPFGVIYENLSLSFICTAPMEERYFFDRWTSYISDPSSNYMHYYDEYKSNIMIETLTQKGTPSYVIVVEEAYPIAVLPQALSYADENSYLRLTVDFAYRRWRNIDEIEIGNKITYGHNIKPHIMAENNPEAGLQFPPEWQAPDELVTQQDFNSGWHDQSSSWFGELIGRHETTDTETSPSPTTNPESVPTPDIEE